MAHQKCFILSVASLLLIPLAGCEKSSDSSYNPPEPTVTLERVEVSSDGSMQGYANSYQLPLGYPAQYKATAVYSDSSTEDVTNTAAWSASEQCVSVTTGVVQGVGLCNDGVVSASFEGKQGVASVKVIDAVSTDLFLEARDITLLDLPVAYKAYIRFDNDLNHEVTNFVDWNINDKSLATISKVGLLTPQESGDIEVSAYYEADELMNSEILAIYNATSEDVDVHFGVSSESGDELLLGMTGKLFAKYTISDGDKTATFDVSDKANWESCDRSKISISDSGAWAAGLVDDCEVKGSHQLDGGEYLSDTIYLSTFDAEIESIAVECEAADFFKETSCNASMRIEGKDSLDITTSRTVRWNSSNFLSVSVVDGVVSSTQPREQSDISVHYWTDQGGIDSNSVSVTVGFPSADINIEVASNRGASTYIGGNVQLKAFSDGYDITNAAVWSVDNPDWSVEKGKVIASRESVSGEKVIIKAELEYENDFYEDTQTIEVINLPECGTSPSAGECLKTIDAHGLTYVSSPSLMLIEALENVDTYGTEDELGSKFSKFTNGTTVGLNQVEMWCDMLSSLQFKGQDTWSRATKGELFALEGVQFEELGWPVKQRYWTSSFTNSTQYYSVDIATQEFELEYLVEARYAICKA